MLSFLSNLVLHLQILPKNVTQVSKTNSSKIKSNCKGFVDSIIYLLTGAAYLLTCLAHYL